jgi:D-glycero-alpha-D-manno-heptose-7-phosphate kinase
MSGLIISRTPLRISLVGGGTDLPSFCDVHGGAVVSTSVDKWIHVIVAPRFEGDLRISYSQTEIVETANEVEHELVRETLRVTGLPRGLDILTLADVPSRGTGLGSSSAVTVGLLNSLYGYQGVYKSPVQLAEEAAQIEIDVLGKPIGRQDHYAAALGGFNFLEFLPGGGVRAEPLICPPGTLERLHDLMLLLYTGKQRSAAAVLRSQQEAIVQGDAIAPLMGMRDMAYELRDALAAAEVERVGEIMHRNWELKRSLAAGVSSPQIDVLYEKALANGATGGKLLGAGGGGFLLLIAPPEQHAPIRSLVQDLREVPVNFTRRGTQIMYRDPRIVYLDRPVH